MGNKDLDNTHINTPTSPNPRAFADLKKLVEEELGQSEQWDNFEAVFQPVTEGLGLESPAKAIQAAQEAEEAREELKKEHQVARIQQKAAALHARVEVPDESVEEILSDKDVPPQLEILPPPGRSPSIWRRVFAGIIDQAFVGTLWLIAMVITLKVMTGSFVGSAETQGVLIGEERFLQFAVLEFAAVWLAYLIFCIGLLDMTFGMWVWGIRVGYMTKSRSNWILKKFLRTAFTFIFYAPVLPLVLLIFKGKRQRNLLDTLSGTVVYQSV